MHVMKTLSVALLTVSVGFAGPKTLTTNGGVPVGDNQNSKTAGPSGPVLLEDIHLIEKLASFDRERIPERVVHARGVGAHGEFVVANSMREYTKAAFLQKAGQKTPVFVRFSTVIHPSGSPEPASSRTSTSPPARTITGRRFSPRCSPARSTS